MNKIQLHYDSLSVIPNDIDTIHKIIEPFKDEVEIMETFDEEELDENLPTIFVENLETFTYTIKDEETPKLLIKSLLLLDEAIKLTMEKLNERK